MKYLMKLTGSELHMLESYSAHQGALTFSTLVFLEKPILWFLLS
jgi:hypothetical protein